MALSGAAARRHSVGGVAGEEDVAGAEAVGQLRGEAEVAGALDRDLEVVEAGAGADPPREPLGRVVLDVVGIDPGSVVPAVAAPRGQESARTLRVADGVDAVAVLADDLPQGRSEDGRDDVAEAVGSAHGNPERSADRTAGAIGGDEVAGADGADVAAGHVAQHDLDALRQVPDARHLGVEVHAGGAEGAQVIEQHRLEVVLRHAGGRRRTEQGGLFARRNAGGPRRPIGHRRQGLRQRSVPLDVDRFRELMEEHREISRAGGERSDVTADNPVPSAPFFGPRTLTDIPLDEVFALLDLDELYRLQWGARGSGPEYEATVRKEFEPTLARLKESAKCDRWLQPRAVYGLFPTQSQANDLVVYDPAAYAADGTTREIARFHFPRQEGRERLCIADYFRSSTSTDVDIVGFQVVTVGDAATERFQTLQNSGEYTEAFYVHGLAVETAEAVAEWMHRKIRHDLGVPAGQGKRYSWGYGACPDLEDHAQLFKILPVERELGMQLTSAYQLIPEQSTAAIIVHHPQAKYYAVRGEGVR